MANAAPSWEPDLCGYLDLDRLTGDRLARRVQQHEDH